MKYSMCNPIETHVVRFRDLSVGNWFRFTCCFTPVLKITNTRCFHTGDEVEVVPEPYEKCVKLDGEMKWHDE